MGLGQSLLTIISMMMLTMISIRMNSNILRTQDSTQNSKFGLAAISLAESRIEKAMRLAFDEKTINAPQTLTSSLTAAGSLGKDAGETNFNTFDDFDDFNNFTETDSTLQSAVFKVSSVVVYINPDNGLSVTSASTTWNKKITVSVSSISMSDTIRLSSIYSYWFFR